MSYSITDRRSNPGAKNLPNRQKFLRRANAAVKDAVKKATEGKNIKDALDGGEVSIPHDGMNEPQFRREGGIRDIVLPGNKKFLEGDILPRSGGGGDGKPSDAGEGDSMDEFRFILSREEFINLFLDDLELPDLEKRQLVTMETQGVHRAGYATAGSAANLAIGRTVRLAMARRIALGRPKPEALEALEKELENCGDEDRRSQLLLEIEELRAKMRRIPFIDPIDIRYRNFEKIPKPHSQAVMFCLMDVSGSMSEHMKDLAKRFFMLLYFFLERRYKHVELVFIRHTDKAQEVDQQTFFHDPASGGTLVSSALVEMNRIVKARFRPDDWNIYVAQASDGDNAHKDNEMVETLLNGTILPITQFFAYLEVGDDGKDSNDMPDSGIWTLYQKLKNGGVPLGAQKACKRSEIFPVFRELFKQRKEHHHVHA